MTLSPKNVPEINEIIGRIVIKQSAKGPLVIESLTQEFADVIHEWGGTPLEFEIACKIKSIVTNEGRAPKEVC